jgi:hypothetical protein
MSNRTLIIAGIAVALAVASVATYGALAGPSFSLMTAISIGAVGLSVGATIGTYAFAKSGGAIAGGPSQGSKQGSKAQQVEIATASEGFPVSVIFGTTRIVGNFTRFEPKHSTSVPIKQTQSVNSVSTSSGGGKGGGGGGGTTQTTSTTTVTVGYRYKAAFEYALCMGPIDAIRNVWTQPNQATVREVTGEEFTEFVDDDMTLSFSGKNSEGGSVRLYRGASDQSRVSSSDPYEADGMTYKNVCYAVFLNGYTVGEQPSAKTYAFELQRFPKPILDNGTAVAMETRGSTDEDHPCYLDANPAACIWEILTNKLWGRGLSSDRMDQASFIAVASALARQNVGMSFELDSAGGLADILDGIRNHCGVTVLDNGDKIVCRWIHDIYGDTYERGETINESMVTNPRLTRKTINGQVNELRIEFADRTKSYQSSLYVTHDMASINATGIINSHRLSLSGYTNLSVVQRQAKRILRELSYPFMTLTFNMNRYNTYLEPSDVFAFRWKDWDPDNAVTGWFRVVSIDDDEQSEDGLRITAVEDPYLSPSTEESPEITQPVPAHQTITELDETDTHLEDDSDGEFLSIEPVHGIELNPWMAKGERKIAIMGQKPASYYNGANVYWSLDGASSYNALAYLECLTITGTLDADLPVGNLFDRGADGFTITLTNDDQDGADLLQATQVEEAADDMEELLNNALDYLIIGNEIFKIGNAESLGSGQYRITNYARALLGSEQEAHSAGENVFYLPELDENLFIVLSDSVTHDVALDWQANGVTITDVDPTSYGFEINDDEKLQSLALRAVAPSLYSRSGSGPYTFKIRQRRITGGSGFGLNLQTMLENLDAEDDEISHVWKSVDGSDVEVDAIQNANSVYTAPDQTNAATGTYEITLNPSGGASKVWIYSVRNGLQSKDYLEIEL